ncbi:MAG: polysaccharide biosynthesis protein, partial [Synergistes sp.]|nr:polysaccharide biosynthesis protein [Synergistes sp.]
METIFNKIRGFFLWVGAKNRRVFVCDFLCIAAALAIGYSMRLTFFFLLLVHAGDIWGTLAVFSSAILAALYLGRIYSVFWQRASVEEYFSFARWYFVGISVFVILNMYVRALFMPRSTLLIAAPLAFIFMMGMRATFKLTEAYRKGGEHTAGRALIVGAGDAGTAIARDLLRKANTFVPIGFIDDDPGLRGMTIASLKVLGGREVLHDAIADHSIDTVLIAMPSASGE